jgi:hypothetical protein
VDADRIYVAKAGQGLVDGIVHDLGDEVVQTRESWKRYTSPAACGPAADLPDLVVRGS